MSLLANLFGYESLNRVFDDRTTVQRMLDFEAALARAEATAGVIPKQAAGPIAISCKVDMYDLPALSAAAVSAGNIAIPLVKQLTAKVTEIDKTAARFVHWGATSQDVMDTGLVLQLREALALLNQDAAALCVTLAHLADKYRATPLAARSWLQQAVPTTLGLKFAGWLDALERQRARWRETAERVAVLQFGGAGGTLASLGDKGIAVAEALAAELKLTLPAVPWHAARDRVAEVAVQCGLLCGVTGKIARDISLLAQSEVGEVSEPAAEGRGGSSTLPHKRNPVTSAVVLAAATRVPGLVSTMLSAMVQEHERALGGWQAEWETLPQIVCLSGGALHHLAGMMNGLEIQADRMLQNLDATHGLIFAERAAMLLAERVGKSAAHELLQAASAQAVAEKRHLRDVLLEDKRVRSQLASQEIRSLFDPLAYLGMADKFISRVLDSATKE